LLDLAPDLIVEPTGIAFNNDGTKMFITDRATGLINEYALLAGYDISVPQVIFRYSILLLKTLGQKELLLITMEPRCFS
jgi:sugar lactone lactonase YvrE